jgi:hypothetical protein
MINCGTLRTARAHIGEHGFRVTNILRGATLIHQRKMRAAKDPIGDETTARFVLVLLGPTSRFVAGDPR